MGTSDIDLKLIAKALGQTVGTIEIPAIGIKSTGFRLTVDGRSVAVFAFARTLRYRHEFIEILVEDRSARGYLEIERSSSWTRAMAAIRATPDVANGDGEFARRTFVVSDEPVAVQRAILAAPEVRAAVLTALESFPRVTISPEGVSVVAPATKFDVGAGAFSDIVGGLVRIAEAHPEVSAARGIPVVRVDLRLAVFAWLAVTFVVLGVGGALSQMPLAQEDRITSILLGALGWPGSVALVYLFTRGSYRASAHLGLALWMGLFLSGPMSFILTAANNVLDRSPAVEVATTVVSKTKTRNRSSTNYQLQLQPPAEARIWARNVTAQTYAHTREHDTVTLKVHPGAFGWRWADGSQAF